MLAEAELTAAGVRAGTLMVPLDEIAAKAGVISAKGKSDGSPRSVAFNVQVFRVAVHRATGEVRILKSIHAADAGTVMNPMQCRGQIEGGVAQAIGGALYEHIDIDATGCVTTRTLRNYHIPAFADVPRTEVLFAKTEDALGPLGAKSMSESPYNPIAAALANAIRRATGCSHLHPASRRRPHLRGLVVGAAPLRIEGAVAKRVRAGILGQWQISKRVPWTSRHSRHSIMFVCEAG